MAKAKRGNAVMLRHVHTMLERATALGCETIVTVRNGYYSGRITLEVYVPDLGHHRSALGGWTASYDSFDCELSTDGIAIDLAKEAGVPHRFAETYAPNERATREADLAKCKAEAERRAAYARKMGWEP